MWRMCQSSRNTFKHKTRNKELKIYFCTVYDTTDNPNDGIDALKYLRDKQFPNLTLDTICKGRWERLMRWNFEINGGEQGAWWEEEQPEDKNAFRKLIQQIFHRENRIEIPRYDSQTMESVPIYIYIDKVFEDRLAEDNRVKKIVNGIFSTPTQEPDTSDEDDI